MTKQEIISLIRGFTLREDATQRYHERFLIAAIEDVLKDMYNDIYKVNPNALDVYTRALGDSVTYPLLTVALGGDNIYYTTLPVGIINLPCKGSGVRHIYTKVQSGNTFHPMDQREADLLFNTDVAVVSSKIGYRVKAYGSEMRVEYWNMNTTVRDDGVRMDVLMPFSNYADTDIVLIPEAVTKEGTTFVDRVLTKLQAVPPADLSDSNAPPKEQPNK